MKTLVVYDSMFGNTKQVAIAVGAVLAALVVPVSEARPEHLEGVQMLIVGSPTQAFRPLKSMREFLKQLPPGALQGVKVAAFDTRADVNAINNRLLSFLVRLLGYAAESMAAALVKKGGEQMVAPAGFFVDGKEGPLAAGELERSAKWAGGAMV